MSKTRAQLEHENAAQRDMLAAMAAEIEALRDLIAAAAECADVPVAAGATGEDDRLAWRRGVKIYVYLHDIDYGMDYLCAVLAGKAQSLREVAAEPVPYKVHQPEPAQDDEAREAAEFAADAASLDDLEPLPERDGAK